MKYLSGLLLILPFAPEAWAGELPYNYPLNSQDCSAMMVWDVGMAMCMPLPMAGMPMKMAMLHGNIFGVGITEEGPRGRNDLASPNMVMADLGTSLGDRHYLNLDLMVTAERWTVPERGYPELLQIGEHDENGNPFVDAQHPHSSPIMGLTLSDTIRLDTGHEKDHLKLFFGPRAESVDGPVPFMHRPTGMANPDAPLGHHIGQDVGHISSTVFGASLKLGDIRIEASAFNGTEPEPTKVDLPLGVPNSYAVRLVGELSPRVMAMASVAYVKEPEHDDPGIPFVRRYSASIYNHHSVFDGWTIYNSLIFGLIHNYDFASSLASFSAEFWLFNERSRVFGRIEVLERTPAELRIPVLSEPNTGRWVTAATLGYTYALAKFSGGELGIGGSVTKDFLPGEFSSAYGGNPWTGRVFAQLSGMRMWDF